MERESVRHCNMLPTVPLVHSVVFWLRVCMFLVDNQGFLFAGRSGLEQDDMRILYRYLTTSLFPRHSEPEVSVWQWT